MTTCPKCGEDLERFLPNSLLCEYCYQAAIFGGTAEDWKRKKAAYLAACAREQAKRDAARA